MIGTESHDRDALDRASGALSDEDLTALALAADPDTPIADDAVPLSELTGTTTRGPLPEWYMPAASGGQLLTGWRRVPPVLVVGSLLAINACGLCITYGRLAFT
jgi:hypothetical protein